MHVTATVPSTTEMLTALRFVADFLGVDRCWYHNGRFHFRVAVDRTVAITPESARRLRVETCWRTVPRGRTWTRIEDRDRLAELVRGAVDEMLATA